MAFFAATTHVSRFFLQTADVYFHHGPSLKFKRPHDQVAFFFIFLEVIPAPGASSSLP